MKSSDRKVDVLPDIEQVLAHHHPFGDYRYINERTWVHYECRLEMLAEHMPAAGRTLAAFRKANAASRYRVMGDPVVRSTIDTALAYFKLGCPEVPADETKSVLSIAAGHLAKNSRLAPLAAGARKAKRLGRASYHAWVWCDERDEDIPAQRFRRLFTEYLTTSASLTLWTPDEHGHRMLLKGTRLLSELLPKLARSALNHAHLLAIVESPLGVTSVTNPHIPGTAFFSSVVLEHPWRVAEYLLHESLHLKFIDLEHTHSMLRRGYSAERSPKIRAPWNRSQSDNSSEWPVNRVLTVMHTYTCLALFFKMVERRAPELEKRYGPLHDLDPALSARRALDRAQYLGHKLKEARLELGLAGRRFVDWLLEVVALLDPCPPSTDSNAHLMLDLYDRETDALKKLITKANPVEIATKDKQLSPESEATSIQQIILDLVQNEISGTHRLLSTMGGVVSPFSSNGLQTALGRLDNASPGEMASRFYSERSLISRTLSRIVAEAHDRITRVQQVMAVDQHVQAMLEEAGVRMMALNQWLDQ